MAPVPHWDRQNLSCYFPCSLGWVLNSLKKKKKVPKPKADVSALSAAVPTPEPCLLLQPHCEWLCGPATTAEPGSPPPIPAQVAATVQAKEMTSVREAQCSCCAQGVRKGSGAGGGVAGSPGGESPGRPACRVPQAGGCAPGSAAQNPNRAERSVW